METVADRVSRRPRESKASSPPVFNITPLYIRKPSAAGGREVDKKKR